MSFKCPDCGLLTKTKGGLKLHLQVFHKEQEAPVKVMAKKTPPKSPKKTKAKKEETIDTMKLAEKKRASYKALKKKWAKTPSDFKKGQKIKKAELGKIFPLETTIQVVGTIIHKSLKSLLETTYVVEEVKELKSGWIIYRLRGKKSLVSWKEGQLEKKYYISFPTFCLQ